MKTGRTRHVVIGLLLAWAPLLFVGAIGYVHIVVPLAERILVDEARIAASGIDGLIQARRNALSFTGAGLTLEKVLEPGMLDQLVRRLGQQYPDFLSLEIIDGSGEVAAMAGDISVSEEILAAQADEPRFSSTDGKVTDGSWSVRDNPAGNCIYITEKKSDHGYPAWSLRARFSRTPVENVMASVGSGAGSVVRLVPTNRKQFERWNQAAAKGTSKGPQPGLIPVKVTGPWWSRPWSAQAPLVAPGWQIQIQSDPLSTARTYGVALLAMGLVLNLFIVPLLLRIGREGDHVPFNTSDAIGEPVSEDLSAKASVVEAMVEESDRVPDDSGPDDFPARPQWVSQEAEHSAGESFPSDVLESRVPQADDCLGEDCEAGLALTDDETDATDAGIAVELTPGEDQPTGDTGNAPLVQDEDQVVPLDGYWRFSSVELEDTAGVAVQGEEIAEIDGPPLLLIETGEAVPDVIEVSWDESSEDNADVRSVEPGPSSSDPLYSNGR